jgi:beta-lactamase class A
MTRSRGVAAHDTSYADAASTGGKSCPGTEAGCFAWQSQPARQRSAIVSYTTEWLCLPWNSQGTHSPRPPWSDSSDVFWLLATKTGLERLRAGLPAEYRAGDKTGTGNHGATNDLAIAWPPSKPPILIAAYSWGSTASTERLSDVLAQAVRLVLH